MSAPFVDVIIPAYNGMPWLPITLQSVLDQTYTNIKVYVIDDGSTDSTESYMHTIKDKRVTYIKKDNGGVSSARNLGIQESSSPFIAFLDADDVWLPEKITKQMDIMVSDESIGLVYGHHYVIDDNDVVQGNLRIYKRGDVFGDLVNGNCIAGSASMAIVRRSILDTVGTFREDFINGEDWELWMRIAYVSKIDFVPEIIASIRVHDANAQGNTLRMTDALIHAYDIMKKEFILTKSQQRLLASYCLFSSAASYYHLKEFSKARKTMFRLFRENPPARGDMENWKLHIGAGIYTKILITNPLLAVPLSVIKYPFNVMWKGLRFTQRCIRFGFRVLRYVKRKVR